MDTLHNVLKKAKNKFWEEVKSSFPGADHALIQKFPLDLSQKLEEEMRYAIHTWMTLNVKEHKKIIEELTIEEFRNRMIDLRMTNKKCYYYFEGKVDGKIVEFRGFENQIWFSNLDGKTSYINSSDIKLKFGEDFYKFFRQFTK